MKNMDEKDMNFQGVMVVGVNYGHQSNLVAAKVFDLLNFNVIISNTGGVTFLSGTYSEVLPKELTLKEGTVTINGNLINPQPESLASIVLPPLEVGQVIKLKYCATIKADAIGVMKNTADITMVDFKGTKVKKEVETVVYITPLEHPYFALSESIGLNGRRQNEALYGRIGDIINFTTTITNTGDVAFKSGGFINVLCDGLYLDVNSITINGSVPEPPVQLNHLFMPGVEVDGIIIVKFSVKIISKGIFKNHSRVFMNYKAGSIYNESNETTIYVL